MRLERLSARCARTRLRPRFGSLAALPSQGLTWLLIVGAGLLSGQPLPCALLEVPCGTFLRPSAAEAAHSLRRASANSETSSVSTEQMPRYHFAVSSWLQGGPVQLRRTNVCLVFQVNCPGCFSHSLPALAEIYSSFSDRDDVAVFAIATAFEDFDLNTKENLEDLLRSGTVVGATRRYLEEVQGKDRYDMALPFPVGMDLVEPTPTEQPMIKAKARTLLAALQRSGRLGLGADMEEAQAEMVADRIGEMITSRPFTAETFDVNCLQGTPSWAIFGQDGTLHSEWLGSRPVGAIKELVEAAIVSRPGGS
mmetsp:Transcript_7998/g.17290  ORF Transcript_7998/g.17290 Transcript_7998/m.17290 type:complete len:309 (-) Transcript_7998:25-951(-)